MVVAGVLGSSAHASTFRWTWTSAGHVNGNQPGGGELFYNAGGGGINSIVADYTPGSKRLRYEVEFNNRQTNGYWLAVSPGPNPKGHAGELALFYFDASSSTPALLAYAYNGVNGGNSYLDGSPAAGTQAPDFILSSKTSNHWINQLSVVNGPSNTRKMIFDIDATQIQNHVPLYPGPGGPSEWTGASFAERFGIWFHPLKGLQTSYNANGSLKTLHKSAEGWLDGQNLETVPEPMTMTALGLGIAAFMRKRKAR